MTKERKLSEQGMGRMIDALSGYDAEKFAPLVNRVLKSVRVENGKSELVFEFEDGAVRYEAEGDCCSSTWIEHLESPDDLAGATITEIGEAPVIDATEDDGKNPKDDSYSEREHVCLQVYQTIFRTTKGDISVEYRNSSNGYYGGSLRLITS